jgi:GTP-binding protein
MFVDRAQITVKAGNGGSGAVAWRKQKYEPKGGPHGGDGGKGGDVIFEADLGLNTLLDFKGRPLWEAQTGQSGMKKQMHGSDGLDRVIRVPAGTMIFDDDSGELICDLAPGQRFTIAKGGGGGFGNEHYKSSTNQSPTYAHPGFPGEERRVRLELKLIADVGLIGMPNAGKSTLLAALTRAHPKIGDYPFTTLAPQLGVAELDPLRRIVIADIPGLIEGASDGAGLGLDFLRHVERTRVLVHLLDALPPDGSQPRDNYRTIRHELAAYSPVLAERDEVVVLNKLDLLGDDAERRKAVDRLRTDLKLGRDTPVVGLSGAARLGTRELLETLWGIVRAPVHAWSAPAESSNGQASAGHASSGQASVSAPATPTRANAGEAIARKTSTPAKSAPIATGSRSAKPKPAPKAKSKIKAKTKAEPKVKVKVKAKAKAKSAPKANAKSKAKSAAAPKAKPKAIARAKPTARATPKAARTTRRPKPR